MIETRLALEGEIQRQKELWKLCFGDEQSYIDHYYTHLYRPEQTAVLVADGVIASMLTMLPVSLLLPQGGKLDAAMIYAVATDPVYQGHGYGSKLMQFAHNHLAGQGKALSVLVPASQSLFGFYGNRGYFPAFSLCEAAAGAAKGDEAVVAPASPQEYEHRRDALLKGRLHIGYTRQGIAYQQSLCKATGADLYAIDLQEARGCAAVERLSPQKVLVKELLLPGHLMGKGLAALARQLPAQRYMVRAPGWRQGGLGGQVRPFAMARWYDKSYSSVFSGPNGYLALAYD